ncbi:MAG TPA: hypothetical protein VEJ89_15085 [Myxococcaceae bacterium]|nr:hypothetical protein [Myxococcaceae bacterium]
MSTIAACIAVPGTAAGATGDDTQTKKPASKSTKPAAKSTSKSSSKSTGKSASKSAKSGSSKATASKNGSKNAKPTPAAAKKPASAPAPSASRAAEAARAAFDPVAPSSTSIPGSPAATASTPPGQRGPTRIDFDDRLIQGQRNTAGAVYLYDRKELKQRSMIKKRESFREEIVGVVYDSEL